MISRNLVKLVKTANKAFKSTRNNAGKLVNTVEKNGRKIETYEKQVGKYNPFRRTKTVTTRFVEGETNPTRVTVQRQKGSLFQTHTRYADDRSATSVVDVKAGKQFYNGPSGSYEAAVRDGLAQTHKDNFTRGWVIGGTIGAGAAIAGGTAYALLGNEEEAAEPIAADKADTKEPEEEIAVPVDSTAIEPEATPAPADSVPAKPAAPAVPADSVPTDSVPRPNIPVAPTDSVPTDSVPRPNIPAVPTDSVPAAPADSIPTQPAAPADSIPARPTVPTDSVPARPTVPADSVPAQPTVPADSIPTQPAQPAAPVQPAQPTQPAAPAQPAPAPATPQTPSTNNIFGGTINGITTASHDVVKGDCLWNIAKHYLREANPGATITNGQILAQVKEFIRLNPQIKNPDLIYPNQQIKMCA